MNNENIWSSISRKIAGESTEEDIRMVNEWLNEKPTNNNIYSKLVEMWNTEKLTSENHESIFDSVKRRIAVHENLPRRRFYTTTLFKAAAVILLLLASNIAVYLLNQKPETEAVAWQEIVVPRGNRMKVTLPDSTFVWLNNESTLRYSTSFSRTNREIELSGEAYFDVRHDAENPFTVKIGEKQIKVLGTRFSVNAYPEDRYIETSLISGSVIFKNNTEIKGQTEFKLNPGNSIFYDKQNNSVSTQKIQTAYYDYWEKGVYAFKDERFEDLALKIKRIFNIEIVFNNDFLKNKTYTGTIGINDNIFVFMEAIRRTSLEPIEYSFNKNIINVKLKNNKNLN